MKYKLPSGREIKTVKKDVASRTKKIPSDYRIRLDAINVAAKLDIEILAPNGISKMGVVDKIAHYLKTGEVKP